MKQIEAGKTYSREDMKAGGYTFRTVLVSPYELWARNTTHAYVSKTVEREYKVLKLFSLRVTE